MSPLLHGLYGHRSVIFPIGCNKDCVWLDALEHFLPLVFCSKKTLNVLMTTLSDRFAIFYCAIDQIFVKVCNRYNFCPVYCRQLFDVTASSGPNTNDGYTNFIEFWSFKISHIRSS